MARLIRPKVGRVIPRGQTRTRAGRYCRGDAIRALRSIASGCGGDGAISACPSCGHHYGLRGRGQRHDFARSRLCRRQRQGLLSELRSKARAERCDPASLCIPSVTCLFPMPQPACCFRSHGAFFVDPGRLLAFATQNDFAVVLNRAPEPAEPRPPPSDEAKCGSGRQGHGSAARRAAASP